MQIIKAFYHYFSALSYPITVFKMCIESKNVLNLTPTLTIIKFIEFYSFTQERGSSKIIVLVVVRFSFNNKKNGPQCFINLINFLNIFNMYYKSKISVFHTCGISKFFYLFLYNSLLLCIYFPCARCFSIFCEYRVERFNSIIEKRDGNCFCVFCFLEFSFFLNFWNENNLMLKYELLKIFL